MVDVQPVLARFSQPVAARPTRLAILSDLHLSVTEEGTWRVSHRTEERLSAAVRSLNRHSDLDGVLFAGDLVQSGTREEYEAFDRVITDLDVPMFAIPGNHDLIADGSQEKVTLPEFEERYTPGGLPYHWRIGGLDLLALNSNSSTRDSLTETYIGEIASEELAWLEKMLATVEHPLVAIHHNLPGMSALYTDALEDIPAPGGSPGFENADELVAVLDAYEVPLVLTGHLHFPAIATSGSVRELTLPALGPYPNAYTVLEIDSRGTTAFFHSVAAFDERIESFAHGFDVCRVMLSATQLAGLPLVDDFPE